MNILGISCFYHDSAACLVQNGKVVAAAEEERFTRTKHDFSFPLQSSFYCLKEGGITAADLDAVVFYEKPLLKFERLLSQHLEKFPLSLPAFIKALPSWLAEKLRLPSIIRKELKYKGDIFFLEHHLSHAASAFLPSPFEEAAILTVDGVGEWATATLGEGRGKEIKIFKELHFPHSLGLLYSTITAFLGFSVNNSEYKVMGLAAYGQPCYLDKFKKIVKIHKDGSLSLNMKYFSYHYKLKMPAKKFFTLFGPPRRPTEPITQYYQDIAASLQHLTEEVYFKMLNYLYQLTKKRNVCLAGGVALNSVANGKIKSHTPFENVWIQPAASDAGGSLGAALYFYNCVQGQKRIYQMDNVYLGPSFTEKEIKKFLDDNHITYQLLEEKNLLKRTAQLIYQNKIIGWFQGRLEWGPRALGNRSILANPLEPKMKDILNLKVKHREKFRPFAPVVTKEDAAKFFVLDRSEVPFMLFVYPLRKEYRHLLPAITHVDGSCRLQTISREQNQRYYDLIREFEKLSGLPILVNTSFNIRGEPIVCTPRDAYRCMMGTGIDYLVLGSFLIARQDNLRDSWNSEELARD